MKSVYFAGPDVFSPDYPRLISEIKAMCAANGLEPLLPGDKDLATSEEIFHFNLSLIKAADGIIANLNPFRGAIEPDSGTVFECAYAFAGGKWVIGYLDDQRDMLTKLRQTEIGPSNSGLLCRDGTVVEDFNLPLNLMLAHGLTKVVDCLQDAVHLAAAYQ